MNHIGLRSVLSVLIIGLAFLGAVGCTPQPTEPTGEFLNFGAEPSEVCMNWGIPTVRIGFTARSSSQQCVNININGESLVSAFQSPEPGIIGQNRCGSGEWGEAYTFSLNTLFGNNVPPLIVIEGSLQSNGLYTQVVEFDTAEASVTSRVCDPPGLTSPGG